MRKTTGSGAATLALLLSTGSLGAHPLDGLTGEEYQAINKILRDTGTVGDETLYPLIELNEPSKRLN